ncbi:MAG: TauD/TfdA family dioxygenase [Acidimicrobiales bacterium]
MTDASRSHHSTEAIDAHNPFLGNRLGIAGIPPVVAAEVGARTVTVVFADGVTRDFHHQWLRHACYCATCGNPADGIRFTTVVNVDPDGMPESANVADGDLELHWSDGHISSFGCDWLRHHAYDGVDGDRRKAWRPVTWRADLADDFPTVRWTDATDGGRGQLRVYQLLRDRGIVHVSDMGTAPARTEQLAGLMGPIHETTVYGRIYDVRAEPVAKLGAKTGMAQAPHIDDAFTYSPPGIDIFHCLVNTSEGGLSTYVDGFAVAESIARADPDAYELLTTVPIAHIRRHPGEIDMRNRGPLISLDEFGRPCGIRYFDRALAPLDCAAELVDPMFAAIRRFNELMLDPAFIARIRVPAGSGMLIDNHRVMHGRTAFDPSSGRHIRLCHVPRDEFHGRLRELSRRLEPDTHDLYLPQGSHNA